MGNRLIDAVHAEAIRTGGGRSIVWLIGVPLAIATSVAVTLAVAIVSERFATIGANSADTATIQVTSVGTTNSVYWVITFAVTIGAIIATYAQATASRDTSMDIERFSSPDSVTPPIARWLYYGSIMAVVSAALVVVTMLVLPAAFPQVYGGVDLASASGARFVWTVPLYAFGACGFGIGIAALIRNPAGSVALLLGWMYVVETAISLAPNGYDMQGYMPFLNAVYATGQELAFTAPWSKTSGLAYFLAVSAAVFSVGLIRIRRGRH
ncbi:ABC transporter permease [Gordonia sp. CPCC 205333]|uniref:ABC transporter permease n=1 Tax=Gordonia sp. CPCC 205333 TaxID=3140790 RepID=UPI003AF3DF0F